MQVSALGVSVPSTNNLGTTHSGGESPQSQHALHWGSTFAPLSGERPLRGDTDPFLHYSLPTREDTASFVDTLKQSDLSQWRSLEEVATRLGGQTCSGAVTTSVLSALYLLGLFNLCIASPASCCANSHHNSYYTRQRRQTSPEFSQVWRSLHSDSVRQDKFYTLPHVTTPDGGAVPVHISVVKQVKRLWDSNPNLVSNVSCRSLSESVQSSYTSMSGVASGLILSYGFAQLEKCYPDNDLNATNAGTNIWLFPFPTSKVGVKVESLPNLFPVPGEDDPTDGCERYEVMLEDGSCTQLLSETNCPYRHWVLLNKHSKLGECIPRLCEDGHVYLESDQMCHHVSDDSVCPGSERLYMDAFGEAVCDCPDGMMRGPDGKCYHLFQQAYCSPNAVLQFDSASMTLVCAPDPCGYMNSQLSSNDLPFALSNDGYCYQFNEQGNCEESERFGIDINDLLAKCVDMKVAGLLRSRRSYTYHHMSHPGSHHNPHYKVSYVILNGTTWNLQVEGSDRRQRRDVNSTKRLVFFDTRDAIPEYLQHQLSQEFSDGLQDEEDDYPHVASSERQLEPTPVIAPSSDPKKEVKKLIVQEIMRLSEHKMESLPQISVNGLLNRLILTNIQLSKQRRAGMNQTLLSFGAPMMNFDSNDIETVTPNRNRIEERETNKLVNTDRFNQDNDDEVEYTTLAESERSSLTTNDSVTLPTPKMRRKSRRFHRRHRRRRRRRNRNNEKNNIQTLFPMGRRRKNKYFNRRININSQANSIPSFTTEYQVTLDGDDNQSSSGQRIQTNPPEDLPDVDKSEDFSQRDRRQLGTQGGIIQAPLLSACKPGAKRDYNYKCRSKFIPQKKKGTFTKVAATSLPRIKCPKGTKLDPRGKCQAATTLFG